jgi:hypothetical protein
LCGCVSFSVVAGKFYYDRKKVLVVWQESFITIGKEKSIVVYLASCAVVSVFGSGGK